MSQQRMVGGNYNGGRLMNDTTYTKLFVGGLAWETQRDTMKKYFEQFGEILEAVVITDKATGRSKGYGFVTFKDPEAAFRACQNPSPVIDGRRANCNLASFGAQKKGPPTSQHGSGRFRPAPGLMTPPYQGSSSSTYPHQAYAQLPLNYSTYGYTGYSHEAMYNMNYYGVYGQQFSPYYYPAATEAAAGAGAGAGTIGYFHNLYPYYAPYPQSSQPHGFGVQYPQMVQQYPLLPQHLSSTSTGILSLPSSTVPTTSTTTGVTATIGAALTVSGPGSAPPQTTKVTEAAASEQDSSA